jgi:hypothetical protein
MSSTTRTRKATPAKATPAKAAKATPAKAAKATPAKAKAKAKAPTHHEVTKGLRGPSPKWLDHYTAVRKARGDKPAAVKAWRAEMIAKYATLRAHGLKA